MGAAQPSPQGSLVHVPDVQTVRAEDFFPVFNIEQAVARQLAMSEFIGKILKSDADYGVMPGTSKKVLLKPGAEKLCTFFGLTPMFAAEQVVEDWSGEEHGGEPLFYYRYKCQLWRGERLLAEAVGSCNSREKKYRWRGGERICPDCGKATIIKGKAEYGGGYLCFAKKGGCGAKFKDDDPVIIGQEIGQIKNPDIADVVNTCQKMAQKRALVAAVLIGTNASDSFTQDIEEEQSDSGSQAAADAVRDQKLSKSAPEAKSKAGPTKPTGGDLEQSIAFAQASQKNFDDICSDLCADIDKAYGGELMHGIYADAVVKYKAHPSDRNAARRDAVMFLWEAAVKARAEFTAQQTEAAK